MTEAEIQLDRSCLLCRDTRHASATELAVSHMRRYRMAIERLLSQRYRDGECDGAALSAFADEIRDINEQTEDWAKP